MKRLYLLAILLIAGMCAPVNAQFFQHEYWAGDVVTSDGINTKINPSGHVICGVNYVTGGATNMISVVYTDQHGTPIFNREYFIGSAVSATSSPKIIELLNGFGIMGFCSDGIYYFTIDLLGNPGPIYAYWFTPATNVWSLSGPPLQIAKSATGNEIYFAGSFFDNSFKAQVFIGKIDIGGNLLWANAYDMSGTGYIHSVPLDLIESPYTPTGPMELAVVGATFNSSSTTCFGHFFRVDASTGSPIGTPVFYGSLTTTTNIQSIAVSNNPNSGGPGFILGGGTDITTGGLVLAKISPTGVLQWSNSYDDPNISGSMNGAIDVIERQNTNGFYEYYALGTLDWSPGWYDAVVVKTDDAGVPVADGEFIYHDMTYSLMPVSLDQFKGTTFDGLSIFCSKENLNSQIWYGQIIKTYFNGVVDCGETFEDPTVTTGPGTFGPGLISTFGGMQTVLSGLGITRNTPPDMSICYSVTIVGGDSTEPVPEEGSEELISPNPISATWLHAALSVEAKETTTAQVHIYDMLGREYFSRQFELTEGQNTLDLDLSATGMAPGIYTVNITTDSGTTSLNLVVKE